MQKTMIVKFSDFVGDTMLIQAGVTKVEEVESKIYDCTFIGTDRMGKPKLVVERINGVHDITPYPDTMSFPEVPVDEN